MMEQGRTPISSYHYSQLNHKATMIHKPYSLLLQIQQACCNRNLTLAFVFIIIFFNQQEEKSLTHGFFGTVMESYIR